MHIVTLRTKVFVAALALPMAAQTLSDQAMTAWRAGKYADAQQLFHNALTAAERTAGDSEGLAVVLGNLVEFYSSQGKYVLAHEFAVRMLGAHASRQPKPDPDTLAKDHDLLGRLAYAQLKFGDSEDSFKSQMAVLEEKYGAGGLEVIPALNNLARLYQISNLKAADFEKALRRIIAIREKQQGLDHVDVAGELHRLGRFLTGQKKLADAEGLYRRALTILETKLSFEHVQLVPVLDSMGSLFEADKRPEEAEAVYRRSVAIRERASGPMALEIAPALENLGRSLTAQKKFEDAEAPYTRALGIWQLIAGNHHPLTANAIDNLALVEATLGKYPESQMLYKQSLEIRERITVSSMNNLALVYVAQQNLWEAQPLYEVAMNVLERTLPTASFIGPKQRTTDGQLDTERADLIRSTLENYVDLAARIEHPELEKQLQARLKAFAGER